MTSLLVTLLLGINHCYASNIDSLGSLFMVPSGASSHNSEKVGCSQRKCYAEDTKGTSNHDTSCFNSYPIVSRKEVVHKCS